MHLASDSAAAYNAGERIALFRKARASRPYLCIEKEEER
jgi:hypothetical protein